MVKRPAKTTAESLRSAGALSTVGLSFVFALVIGFWIGDRLDALLHTGPAFTILCFFLGLAAGILNVFRIVKQAFPTGTTSQTGSPPAVGDNSGGAPPPEPPTAQPGDDDAPTRV